MAAPVIECNGPARIMAGLDDGAMQPTNVLGHTRDGVRIARNPFWDDVQTEDYGPDTIRDRVFIGEKVFLEFELHSVIRTNIDNFMWLYDTVGVLARLGKKITDLDDSDGSIYLIVESETGQTDYQFKHFAPLRVSQRVGNQHTIVNVRGEAIIDQDNSDEFWDNTAASAGSSTDVPEVAGGHLVKYGDTPTELGITRDGVEIIQDYFYDDVGIDTKGRETNAEKIVTGQAVTVAMQLHAIDVAEFRSVFMGEATYGQLGNVGSLGTAVAQDLFLDSELGANGRDWTFENAVLENEAVNQISARHTIADLLFRALPVQGATKTIYTTAAGS